MPKISNGSNVLSEIKNKFQRLGVIFNEAHYPKTNTDLLSKYHDIRNMILQSAIHINNAIFIEQSSWRLLTQPNTSKKLEQINLATTQIGQAEARINRVIQQLEFEKKFASNTDQSATATTRPRLYSR